jgi:hypothetical protein
MRRKFITLTTSLVLAFAAIVFTPAPRAQASFYTVHYTIIYMCRCGPYCPYGEIQGEWTQECNGWMHGWGVQPYQYESCYETDVIYGEECML